MLRALGGVRGLVPKVWAQPALAQGKGAQAIAAQIAAHLHAPATRLTAKRSLHAPVSAITTKQSLHPPASGIAVLCAAAMVSCASSSAALPGNSLCDVNVLEVLEEEGEPPSCEPSMVSKIVQQRDVGLMLFFFVLLDLLRSIFPQLSQALGLMPFLRYMNSNISNFSFVGDITIDILRLFRNNVSIRFELGGYAWPATNPNTAAVKVDICMDTCSDVNTISPELAKLLQQKGAQQIPWQSEVSYTNGTTVQIQQKLAVTILMTFKGKRVVITNEFLVLPKKQSNDIRVYLSTRELFNAGLITSSLPEVKRVLEA